MQLNRLFAIVYLLLHRPKVTAGELAERFEVSVRTIYRDVEALSGAGIPVYMSKGRGGGISLLDHFVLNKSLLTDREQLEILSALQGLSAIRYPDTDEVLSKLAGLFARQPDTSWMDVDFSPWGRTDAEVFQQLKEAILSKRVLAFRYVSGSGQESARQAEPLQLRFKDKSWYVLAYCLIRQDYRVFKLTRMLDLRLLDEHFVRSLPQDDHARKPEEQWERIRLKLQFEPDVAYRVYDEFDVRCIARQPDGRLLVDVKYPDNEWLYGYLLSYGPALSILEPTAVREEVKARLHAAMTKYP